MQGYTKPYRKTRADDDIRIREGAGDLVSRALNGVTLIITLLITNLLSPLPLQVGAL